MSDAVGTVAAVIVIAVLGIIDALAAPGSDTS
jgi:hypothetical protein